MDRQGLRSVLRGGGEGRAVVVMLERHACRLEQVPYEVARVDPESLARALRSAQQLYGLDAVTVGDGGDLLVRAASALRTEASSMDSARVRAAQDVGVALDAFRRLRTVLAGRAGIVVVLPAVPRLVTEATLEPVTASAVLMETIRAFGEAEPDAFVLTGHEGEPDPTYDALAEFYGAAVIRVGEWTTPGVAVRRDLAPGEDPGKAFLVITRAEIQAELEPAEVRARMAAARATGLPGSH